MIRIWWRYRRILRGLRARILDQGYYISPATDCRLRDEAWIAAAQRSTKTEKEA